MLCECDRNDCIAQVEVPVGVHADVCASPTNFIVLPDHELAGERILAQSPAYSIVAGQRDAVDLTVGEPSLEPVVGTWPRVAAPQAP